jgi:hypothetical protein
MGNFFDFRSTGDSERQHTFMDFGTLSSDILIVLNSRYFNNL